MAVDMATIEGLCKRRGFIFRSSEIYGGFNGFFDYGPSWRGIEKQHQAGLVERLCA